MAEYIERERTVELLRSLGNREYRKEKGTIQDAIKMISCPEYTPAADVAPVVHGRWEQCFEDWRKQIEGDKCSICGFEHYSALITNYNYCPNCGAQMHEDDFCSYGECREGKDEK